MTVKLAICIPTYNRASFLRETLENLIEQATGEVEITVSDNGSEDNTSEVVAHYQKVFPRLVYFRFEKNQGPGRNFMQCIAIATAPYCWLMGSDDKLEPGAIQRVLEVLDTYPNLAGLSVNFCAYDRTFSRKIPRLRLPSTKKDQLFTSFEELFPFPAIYLGYISGQIVKKSLWTEVVNELPVEDVPNAYVHLCIFIHVIKKHPKWFYIHKQYVGNRTGNDSISDKGSYRRLEIDILGYDQILKTVVSFKQAAYLETMKWVGKSFVKGQLLGASLNGMGLSFWKKSLYLCWKHYARYLFFWTQLLPLFLLPSFFWKTLRWVYRLLIKKNRLFLKRTLSW